MLKLYKKSFLIVIVFLLGGVMVKLLSNPAKIPTKAEYIKSFVQQSSKMLCTDAAFMAFNQCFEPRLAITAVQ